MQYVLYSAQANNSSRLINICGKPNNGGCKARPGQGLEGVDRSVTESV